MSGDKYDILHGLILTSKEEIQEKLSFIFNLQDSEDIIHGLNIKILQESTP